MFVRLLIAACAAGCIALCDNPQENKVDCSTLKDPQSGVELVYPLGGETLNYGSTVNVKWKVDPNDVPSVVLGVSTTGESGPYKSIIKGSMSVPLGTGVMCMDTVWTIGNEYATVNWPAEGTTVHFRVAKYNDEGTYNSITTKITIKH